MSIEFIKIDGAASGANTLVAAATGVTITVLNYTMVAANTVTVTFKSDTTALTGAMSLAVAIPVSADSGRREGLMKTAKGEALIMTLSGAVQVSGHMLIEKT